MNHARPLIVAFGCTLGVVACDRNSEAPTAPSTPQPVASTEATTAAPEALGTTEAPGTTDVAKAPSWRPTKCASYSFTPKDCSGSAENPNCTDSFELQPDGKAVKVFDDIMTRGSYESSGNTVTISVPERNFNETFTIEDDGKVLVGPKGARYQRKDCP